MSDRMPPAFGSCGALRHRGLFFVPWLLLWVLSCPPPCAGGSQPAPPASQTPSDLDQLTGPVLETMVVGLNLQGERHRDRIRVPDLDVIYLNEGEYLLPLLRILHILSIEVTPSGTTLTFRPEGAPEAVIDFTSGEVTSGTRSRTVALQVGVSDVTGRAEVYVPADVLGEILGMDIRWDETAYEYVFYTDQKLRVFEQFYPSTPSLFTIGTQPTEIHLPGNLPPAQVGRLSAPDLNFAELRTQTRLATSDGFDSQRDRFTLPQAKIWGQMLGGNLQASIRQKQYGSVQNLTVDQASWTTWFDHSEMAAGNSHFGISDLIFPSVDLIGVRFNGLAGPGNGRLPGSEELDRQQSFLPTHVFEGYAPLGATVTLFINDREVTATAVETSENAPLGMGVYRFEGVNLLTRQINDIRIVTAAPDGTVEETRREVLGTDLLIPEGKLSYLGGSGTGRAGLADEWHTDGFFAGGRVLYGLRHNLSVGMAGAFQERLAGARINTFGFYNEDFGWVPDRSIHFGPRIIWQPRGRLLINGEAAGSYDAAGSATDWACRLRADYQHRSFTIRPNFFLYGPSFFDGRNVLLRDRAGANVGISWRLGTGNVFGIGATRVRDNLDHSLDQTMSLDIAQASWATRSLIPQSALTLSNTQLWSSGRLVQRIFSVGFDTALLPKWSLRSTFELGDDFRLGPREEALRSQGIGDLGMTGPRTSRVELARRLGKSWRLAFGHRRASNLDRSFIDISRRETGAFSFQWRSALGYDWQQEAPYVDARLEFTLDEGERNRILVENRYFGNSWILNVWLQIRGLFGFVDHRPFWIRDGHLNPAAGGVKGRVFLDFNANGLLDSGEPGLKDVNVVSNAGSSASSGRNGQFVLSSSTRTQQMRVRLEPETLPAIYTPTQAIQDAMIKPGLFSEVNLGVAAFGSISGTLTAATAGGGYEGIWGVRVLLRDENGTTVGNSVTSRDGYYYLGEVRPGKYTVVIDEETLPPGYQMDVVTRDVEVLSGTEPFEVDDLSFLGEYLGPPPEETHEIEDGNIKYKVFE